MTLDLVDRGATLEADRPAAARSAPPALAVIDCDVHPTVGELADLRPFLEERWWRHLLDYGPRPRHAMLQGDPYPKAAPRAARRDAWSPDGGQPGSDLAFMRRHYFDAYGIEYAILSPLAPTGQGDRNLEFGAALCRAMNDWQLARWAEPEPRCRLSIVVPYEDAALSVAEIERCARDSRFVQVLVLTRTSGPLGRRRYWPILEAACHHGLPVAVHVFGYGGHPVTGAGWPSYYCEEMTGHSGACQAMVASLVLEGALARLPELRVISVEGGFGWLPALTWRLDRHWQRARAEVPHVVRPPSEYLREQLLVTTQPMEEPERQAHLLDCMAWIGHDRLLLATDYPHWDFDDPRSALPRKLPLEVRRQIASENARRLFRLG